MKFFDPWSEIHQSGDKLPHWEQSGATYFVTFRLADAIPAGLRREYQHERDTWLSLHPEPWSAANEAEYHQRFSGQIERWLDAGHGSCFLRDRQAREIVVEALQHFDGERYRQVSFIVMPNHVHTLFTLGGTASLGEVLHAWKSYTAHAIRKTSSIAPQPFWKPNYFDRIIRDEKHLANCIRYTRRNPEKAGLPDHHFTLFESEFAKSIH